MIVRGLLALATACALLAGASVASAQGGAVVPGDVGSSSTPVPPVTPPTPPPPPDVDASGIVEGAVDQSTSPHGSAGAGLDPGAVEDDEEEEEEEAPDERGEDVVATLGTVVGTAPAAAQIDLEPRHRIVWREDWPRYSFDEAVLSLGLGALLVAAELLPTATASANWTGGILFDDPVEQNLRLQSAEARETARVASEVLQWVMIASPFVIDALGAVGIVDGNWDAAFQMGLIALESYVISLVVWKVTVLLARRERPVATRCRESASPPDPSCEDGDFETTSFFSNQTMNAFTGASLMCLHHTHMPLFDDEAADASACVVGMTVASAVGLLRVMSNQEYLTDVLMGAAVGFVAGYIVPWLVHYQGGARPELRPPVALIPAPMVGPGDTYGAMVAGWF
ncbi:phosphatase PAP2 family protein [Sandaracinus amylolyticus]|uniref:phosphatase PAP2 family protein n=1 Tax=Sandaracinus amylolyticus TaxID=927083 RepID=UPI001F157589|nr:phosphatase PAP2 family protein [Sandaracinus amylolyticus]UJR86632.1 Hypothetical protein I5071_87330 [Sandaracinus amylolyticus]